ncbi:MAG: hypothetical protein RDU59_11505 [Thermodesulfobacteriota bacterium]|nr:hypothetical protein [Thermodesulfobacteriota bacterium]
MAFLSFRRTPDRGPGQAPESSNFKQIEIPLDTGFHRCDDFCKSLNRIQKSGVEVSVTSCGLRVREFETQKSGVNRFERRTSNVLRRIRRQALPFLY